MNDILRGHQALIGIVLGYGRENSWQFLEKSERKKPLSWIWREGEYWREQEKAQQYNSSIDIPYPYIPVLHLQAFQHLKNRLV